MTATIRYLARLTRVPARASALQPPRTLFATRDLSTPAGDRAGLAGPAPAVDRADPTRLPRRAPAPASLALPKPGPSDGRVRASSGTRGPVAPPNPAEVALEGPLPRPEATSDGPAPPPAPPPHRPSTPATDRASTRASSPVPERSLRPEQVPSSFLDPIWNEPVALPAIPAVPARPTTGPAQTARTRDAPADDQAAARTAVGEADPAHLGATRPGPPAAPRGVPSAEPPPTVSPAPAMSASTSLSPARSGRPRPNADPASMPEPPDLAPPAAAAMASRPGQGRDSAPRPRRSATEPPMVSIGTIEVTVAGPPSSLPAVPPPPAPQWSAPPPARAGDDQLRNGRRRWYGIAQG
jgi:hypothetical protein